MRQSPSLQTKPTTRYWQSGLLTVLSVCCHTLKQIIQRIAALEKPSKHAENGHIRACLRWLMYVRRHLRLIRLLVKWAMIMRLARRHVRQVKRWQPHMFPRMPSPRLFTRQPLSAMLLTPLMLTLPPMRNECGNINTYSHWEKTWPPAQSAYEHRV